MYYVFIHKIHTETIMPDNTIASRKDIVFSSFFLFYFIYFLFTSGESNRGGVFRSSLISSAEPKSVEKETYHHSSILMIFFLSLRSSLSTLYSFSSGCGWLASPQQFFVCVCCSSRTTTTDREKSSDYFGRWLKFTPRASRMGGDDQHNEIIVSLSLSLFLSSPSQFHSVQHEGGIYNLFYFSLSCYYAAFSE